MPILSRKFAGISVDRAKKRNIIIAANIGRAFLLSLIPLASQFQLLSLEVMYAVAFSVGIFTVLFDSAFWSYVPNLVAKGQLIKANAKLMASSSAAQVGGQGIGGFIVQLVASTLAIFIDAVSFMASAIIIMLIRKEETVSQLETPKLNIRKEIKEGFHITLKNPYLRAIMGEAFTYNFFSQGIMTLFVIYVTKNLELSAWMYGLFLSCGGVGALIGSLFAGKAAKRIGIGPATIWSMAAACTGFIFIPSAGGSPLALAIGILGGFFINGVGLGLSNVICTTLRQSLIPDNLLAKAMSSTRLLTWSGVPLGALAGGFFGDAIGIRLALFILSIGILFAPLWVFFSPLRKLKDVADNT